MVNRALTLELGSSGLEQFSGFVHEEKLRQLQSPQRRNRTFREMGDNDPIAGAVLFALEMLIRQVEWTIEPPAEEIPAPDLEERTEFVQSCFEDLTDQPFKDVVSEMMSVLQFGWYWGEVTFKRRLGWQPPAQVQLGPGGEMRVSAPVRPSSRFEDGRWGWHKIAGRAQDTLYNWVFDDHGGVLAMVQQAPPNWNLVTIPVSKSIHLRTTSRGNNPEGQSIFRRAYRPWYFKKTIEEIQAVGIERDLAGLPVLKVPSELLRPKDQLTAEQSTLRDSLEKTVRNIRRGAQEGVLMPSDNSEYDLSLLSTAGRRQFDTKAILEYYDQRIAMMALADVILLGHERVGSFALASSKTHMLAVAIGAWLDMIQDQFNRRAIPQLLQVNGWPTDQVPRLVHSDVETLDLGILGQYIKDLAAAGLPLFPSPDGSLERHLLGEAGLPAADEDV